MKLEWFEKYLVIVLRTLIPFFRKYRYRIIALDINSRDGDYVTFSNILDTVHIKIIYNPGFDIQIITKKTICGVTFKSEYLSIIEIKNEYTEFSHLEENFEDEEDLNELLEKYIHFLETHYLSVLLT